MASWTSLSHSAVICINVPIRFKCSLTWGARMLSHIILAHFNPWLYSQIGRSEKTWSLHRSGKKIVDRWIQDEIMEEEVGFWPESVFEWWKHPLGVTHWFVSIFKPQHQLTNWWLHLRERNVKLSAIKLGLINDFTKTVVEPLLCIKTSNIMSHVISLKCPKGHQHHHQQLQRNRSRGR